MKQRRSANGLSQDMSRWPAAGRDPARPAFAFSPTSTLANLHVQPLCRRLNHHPASLSPDRPNPTPAKTLTANRSPAIKSP